MIHDSFLRPTPLSSSPLPSPPLPSPFCSRSHTGSFCISLAKSESATFTLWLERRVNSADLPPTHEARGTPSRPRRPSGQDSACRLCRTAGVFASLRILLHVNKRNIQSLFKEQLRSTSTTFRNSLNKGIIHTRLASFIFLHSCSIHMAGPHLLLILTKKGNVRFQEEVIKQLKELLFARAFIHSGGKRGKKGKRTPRSHNKNARRLGG